jgi:hypothetical protein
VQAEGEALSRKNGELEATVRKLRSSLRDAELERDRLSTRVQALESQAGLGAGLACVSRALGLGHGGAHAPARPRRSMLKPIGYTCIPIWNAE